MSLFLLVIIPALTALFLYALIKLEGRNNETWM
jgi:hypothetical protein